MLRKCRSGNQAFEYSCAPVAASLGQSANNLRSSDHGGRVFGEPGERVVMIGDKVSSVSRQREAPRRSTSSLVDMKMTVAAWIRFAVVAVILGAAYYYLLVYLVGWMSTHARPGWWISECSLPDDAWQRACEGDPVHVAAYAPRCNSLAANIPIAVAAVLGTHRVGPVKSCANGLIIGHNGRTRNLRSSAASCRHIEFDYLADNLEQQSNIVRNRPG